MQQVAHLGALPGRPDDDRVGDLGGYVEGLHQAAGHEQGICQAHAVHGGQAADLDVEKTVGAGEQAQIQLQVRKALQQRQQVPQAFLLFFDGAALFLIPGAFQPYLAQPSVQTFELGLRDGLGLSRGRGGMTVAKCQYLLVAHQGGGVAFAIRLAGQLLQLRKGVLGGGGVRAKIALACEFQRQLRQVRAQGVEGEMLHGFRLEHAALSSGGLLLQVRAGLQPHGFADQGRGQG